MICCEMEYIYLQMMTKQQLPSSFQCAVSRPDPGAPYAAAPSASTESQPGASAPRWTFSCCSHSTLGYAWHHRQNSYRFYFTVWCLCRFWTHTGGGGSLRGLREQAPNVHQNQFFWDLTWLHITVLTNASTE